MRLRHGLNPHDNSMGSLRSPPEDIEQDNSKCDQTDNYDDAGSKLMCVGISHQGGDCCSCDANFQGRGYVAKDC